MATLSNKAYSEQELVLFLKNKDREAFNYLYKSYSGALYAVIQNIVHDDHIAEDVLQDVFVKIWLRIDQFEAVKGRIFTWMLNIARNASKDVLRTRQEKMKRSMQPEEMIVDMQTNSSVSTDTIGVKSLVCRLHSDCQTVMKMAYYQGYTILDISKLLQIPEGTVKTRLRKGLSLLRSDFVYAV